MRPRELVRRWVEDFNRADVEALAALYEDDAVNHQVAEEPVRGRAAIREMFLRAFAAAHMVCIVEEIFEDGDVAILEWRDPQGLRGCGFFRVRDGRIAHQRGYWDKLSFLRLHGLSADPFRYRDVVGRWKLRVNEDVQAVLAAIEGVARAAAENEARGAEFELCADGTFISRSHGVELLRAAIAFDALPLPELVFEKAPGATVRVQRLGTDLLRVLQPGKPAMLFDRLP